MNKRHVPDLELCQEFDRLCKEKGIVVPKTEFYWQTGKPLAGSNLEVTSLFTKDSGQAFVPEELISAPLVSELGECLPAYLMIKGNAICQSNTKQENYDSMRTSILSLPCLSKTEYRSQRQQKMLNYLLAKGIITTL